jgi:hypothetical protein
MFFISGYWHQTENLSPFTVAVTDTVVYKGCHESVALRLKAECYPELKDSSSRFIFTPDERLCKVMDHCYKSWKGVFEVNSNRAADKEEMVIEL